MYQVIPSVSMAPEVLSFEMCQSKIFVWILKMTHVTWTESVRIAETMLVVYVLLLIMSRPARRREIIICTMCVHAYVRACVTQFPLKLLQLHIFGKLVVLMNFFALQYFLGLVNFGLLVSE